VEEIAVDEAIAAEDLPRQEIAKAVRSMPLSVAVDAAIATEDQTQRVEEIAAAPGRRADLLVSVIDGNYTLAVEWALLLDPARPDHNGGGWRALERSTVPTIVELFKWVRVAGGAAPCAPAAGPRTASGGDGGDGEPKMPGYNT